MTTPTIPQTVLFPDLFDRRLVATFDQPHASSDGGAVLLKAAERRYGLIDGFARCLVDDRQPAKVRHTLADSSGSGCSGSPADMPTPTMRTGWPTIRFTSCCWVGTLSPGIRSPRSRRFPGSRITWGSKGSTRWGSSLAMSVIERHRGRLQGRARQITLDLDPTDDPTHGAQQLTFFNGALRQLVLSAAAGLLTFDDEAEQYFCAALLRPGNVAASRGAAACCGACWPCCGSRSRRPAFLVRLDGGFATPEMLDFLDAEPRLDYVVAMAENRRLTPLAESAMVGRARRQRAHRADRARLHRGALCGEHVVARRAAS